MIFLGADLSQVEARIELLLGAGSPNFVGTDAAKEAIRLATAHPAEFDIHRWSAATCLDKSEADIQDTDENPERYLGKRHMHGFMRGMGAQRSSDILLVDGFTVTPETCERRLGRLAIRLPVIPEGFFPDVRMQMMRYRGLGTTWGAIWRCDFQRFEEHMYSEGYSYQPVRETVDLINQCGLLPLYHAIKLRRLFPMMNRPTPRINLHGHDSLLVSTHPEDAWAIAQFLERTLAQHERVYAAAKLKVPVTYGLGENWKLRYEFKRLPSQQEFRDAAYDCEARTQGA